MQTRSVLPAGEQHHRDDHDCRDDDADRGQLGPAGAAGIGRATLYKYFTDIESILVAHHARHVEEHLRALVDRRGQAQPPGTRLVAVAEAYASICLHRASASHSSMGRSIVPAPDARLTCVLHRDELTAYVANGDGGWQYLFTADAGRYARLDDPIVRAQYRYGRGARLDGGAVALERLAARRR